MAMERLEHMAGADIEPDRVARWKVCLHEAGHAVAGRRLLGGTTGAVVFSDASGIAAVGTNGAVPASFKEALAIAAGPAAKVLADHHPPPPIPLPAPLEMLYPEAMGPLKAQLRQSLPDAIAIARWCIAGIESQPERWAKRFYWIHREAEVFVARHQREIVETATVLFGRGITTLPAEPAKKGIAHVD